MTRPDRVTRTEADAAIYERMHHEPYVVDDGPGLTEADFCPVCREFMCPPWCRRYVKPPPLEVSIAAIRELQARTPRTAPDA